MTIEIFGTILFFNTQKVFEIFSSKKNVFIFGFLTAIKKLEKASKMLAHMTDDSSKLSEHFIFV